jgi:hypothetical protein
LPRAKLTPVDAKDVQPGDVVNLEFDERADRDLDGLYFYFYLIVSSVAPRANGRVRLEFDGSCSGMTGSWSRLGISCRPARSEAGRDGLRPFLAASQ